MSTTALYIAEAVLSTTALYRAEAVREAVLRKLKLSRSRAGFLQMSIFVVALMFMSFCCSLMSSVSHGVICFDVSCN